MKLTQYMINASIAGTSSDGYRNVIGLHCLSNRYENKIRIMS
jgi:hypothetical protein